MTETVVGRAPEWERLVLWKLRRHRGDPRYDDIRQEAMIGAWLAVQKAPPGCSRERAAVLGAQWRAAEYIRSQPGGTRHRDPPMVSLEALLEQEDGVEAWEPAEADFAPGLVERAALREEADRLREEMAQRLTPQQREVILRKASGQSCPEIAAALGRSESRVRQIITKSRKVMGCEGP